MNKIRILHTIRQGMIGGGETHVLDLVSTLDPQVFESEVLSFTDGEMVSRLSQLGITCHIIHTEKGFDRKVWPQVQQLMRQGEFNLIHAHGTRACSNSFKAAQNLKLPLLYTIHGWSFHQDQGFITKSIRILSEAFLVRKARVNISVSESNLAEGIKRLRMPRAVVIKNGINLSKFDPEKSFDFSKSDLGVPGDKLCVALIARQTIQKDPHTFIKAAAEVLKQTKEAHFVLVGGGDLDASSKALVKHLGVEDEVHFIDFQTNVPGVLKAIDIYCLPSLWEGLPIGVLEAMAMKKAVVATPVDGTREIIRHEETGLLFKERDASALAQSFLRLIKEAPLREQLAEQARAEVERAFSCERVAEEVSATYRSVLR